MAFTDDMKTLLAKLDTLELTEGERLAFGELLGVGGEADEVEGFADRQMIRVQGFNLFDTFPIAVTGRPDRPVTGVVDHKADD